MSDMAHILIADPDLSFREQLCETLGNNGYEVDGVEEGQAVLEALKNRDLDLILSEVNLPSLNGLGLLQQAQNLSPRTMVILISSKPSLESAVMAIRQGAQDYLIKPISTKEVADRILQLLKRRPQAEEVQFLRRRGAEEHEFSGIIGLSGKAVGSVVLSLSTSVATTATATMLMMSDDEITNDDIVDAVG